MALDIHEYTLHWNGTNNYKSRYINRARYREKEKIFTTKKVSENNSIYYICGTVFEYNSIIKFWK